MSRTEEVHAIDKAFRFWKTFLYQEDIAVNGFHTIDDEAFRFLEDIPTYGEDIEANDFQTIDDEPS